MTRFNFYKRAFTALFFCISLAGFSQQIHRFCPNHLGSDYHQHNDFEEDLQEYIQKKRTLKILQTEEEEIYRIPIVVHVVHSNASERIGGAFNTNISDEQIISQIEVLNRDFRRQNPDTTRTPDIYKPIAVDTKIEFCLANFDPNGNPTNGITRHYTVKNSYDFFDDDDDLKRIGYWPSDQYLNIWVTKIDEYQGEQILGYASFPDDMNTNVDGLPPYQGRENDGVVLDYRFFGNDIGTSQGTPYSYGRTAVHEVGHYLGLLHTFSEPSPNCSFDNDYVDDTPVQDEPTDASELDYNCEAVLFSCGSQTMYQNYMDYTNDACMNLYTQDQKDRMRAVLELSPSRKALLNSAGCCSQEQAYAQIPFTEKFDNEIALDTTWQKMPGTFNTNWEYQTTANPSSAFVLQDESTGTDTTYLISPLFILKEYEKENQILNLNLSYSQLSQENDLLLSIEFDAGCNNNWKPIDQIYSEQLTNTNKTLPYAPLNSDLQEFSYQIEDFMPDEYSAIRFRLGQVNKSNKQVHVSKFALYPSSGSETYAFIYPNPNNGIFNLELVFGDIKNVTIDIFDISGKEITEFTTTTYSTNLELNLSDLKAGMYFLKADISGQVFTQKFVIQ